MDTLSSSLAAEIVVLLVVVLLVNVIVCMYCFLFFFVCADIVKWHHSGLFVFSICFGVSLHLVFIPLFSARIFVCKYVSECVCVCGGQTHKSMWFGFKVLFGVTLFLLQHILLLLLLLLAKEMQEKGKISNAVFFFCSLFWQTLSALCCFKFFGHLR